MDFGSMFLYLFIAAAVIGGIASFVAYTMTRSK